MKLGARRDNYRESIHILYIQTMEYLLSRIYHWDQLLQTQNNYLPNHSSFTNPDLLLLLASLLCVVFVFVFLCFVVLYFCCCFWHNNRDNHFFLFRFSVFGEMTNWFILYLSYVSHTRHYTSTKHVDRPTEITKKFPTSNFTI